MTVLADDSGSEAKFQLVDGSNVDDKCSFNGNQAACSAVIVNGGNTQLKVLQSQLPPGFGGALATQTSQSAQSTSQAGQSGQQPSQTQSGFSTSVTQATDSSTSSGAQPTQSGNPNGALKNDLTGAGVLALGGLVASLVL